jgi:ATP-dependent Lon protease
MNRLFSNHPDTNSDSVTSHLLLTEAISSGWNPLKPESESSKLIASSSLLIETSLSEGKGDMQLTGNLGNVMKESASTALTYLHANAKKSGIDPEVFKKKNIHIHVPEGAVPKDGPSAGITMMSALASAFTGKRIKPFLAMTGEITLRGQVLPVGGIKEKILAAKRAGLKEIILCWQNEKDVEEINPEFIKGLKFHYVKTMQQVLDIALV